MIVYRMYILRSFAITERPLIKGQGQYTKDYNINSSIFYEGYSCLPEVYNMESKKSGKDQESIRSSTTPDPGYHIGK